MATKNASNHQGQVKDPEHDGRLKGHHGGEAPKAHAEGEHKDEKGGSKSAKAHAEPAKAHAEPKHEKEPAKAHPEPKKAETSAEDADLKAREYTDAQGNVHHHTKAYMEQHKG